MLTGSLYVADTLESGIDITGLSNTGYVRSLGYEGFNQATGSGGTGGFLLFSGSALPQQSATSYQGVGLEMVADSGSYFRYRTNPSILDIHTETFFLGDPNTQYISGSAGNLEISSSGFYLDSNGDVTASSFIAISGSNVLFDSNEAFADALNIGRLIHYQRFPSYSSSLNDLDPIPSIWPGNIYNASGVGTGPITASCFETFILPGETSIQCSFTYEINSLSDSGAVPMYLKHYISTASLDTFDTWENDSLLGSAWGVATIPTPGNQIKSGSNTFEINDLYTTINDRSGCYSRIYSMLYCSDNSIDVSTTFKIGRFVYRIARQVGGSTEPAADNPAVPS